MADNDLAVKFSGDTSDLNDAVDRSKTLIQRFAGDIKSAFSAIGSITLGTPFDGVADQAEDASARIQQTNAANAKSFHQLADSFGIVGHAIEAIIDVGQRAVGAIEPIRVAAGAFDQTTIAMSSVKAVADRSGLSLTELGTAFADLKNKAKSGDDDVVTALKAIGVSTQEVASMSQDQLAVRMAQAFSTAKDSANKAQAATELFGSSVAAKLVPQLDQGAARMRDLERSANRLGQSYGPELVAKVQGTNALFETAKDRLSELQQAAQAFENNALATYFQQLKPSIDGLLQVFNDFTRNVTELIEYFGGLEGAGQKVTSSLGLVGTAAKYLSEAVVIATTYLEELAVEGVQSIANLGLSFDGLSKVAEAFGRDLEAMATTSASALYAAFHEAIQGVIGLFGDLAQAGKAALSFDLSGVSGAFSKLGTDAQATGSKIKAALTPDLLSNTNAAWKQMQSGADASAKALDQVIVKLETQKKAELALIEGGGAKGSPVAQTRNVSNPKAPDTDDSTKQNDEKLQAAMREADGEVQAVKEAEKEKEMLLTAGVQLHLITEQQKVQATQSAAQQELQKETDIYNQELKLDGLKLEQRQDILNKMKEAQEKYNEEVLKLEIAGAENVQKTWDSATASITGAFDGQVDSVLKGTTRIGTAFKNAMASMLTDAVKFCVGWATKHAEMIAENIMGINAQTAAQVAGAAAGTSAQTASAATSGLATLQSLIKSITAAASATFAGIFAFLSPVLGPAAVGPAAAGEATVMAAAASVPHFDQGAWSLPSSGLAMVHAGEMIVPASPAQALRDAMSGTSGAGGDTHNHYHFSPTITALDTQGIKSFFSRNHGAIAQGLAEAQRRGMGLGVR